MTVADLNQLRTFVAVYETRSVTAAAERLHVTQPTVSYTLGRLRRRFSDELFRRAGNVLEPTPRATRLFGPLHDALAQIDAAVAGPDEFDPAAVSDEFTLALSSLGELTFLPVILPLVLAEAPGVRLRIVPLVASELEESLRRGLVDLSISVTLLPPDRLWREPIREVTYVAATSASHPLPETDAEMFAGRRFIQVSGRAGHTFPNEALIEHDLLRLVSVWVEGYASVPPLLESSDLVALLPAHVAAVFARRQRLATRALPWPVQSPPVSVYTRHASSLSPGQRWLRGLVLRAVREAP